MATAAPLRVQSLRGTEVESEHIVHAIVVDAAGRTTMKYGRDDRLVFPRSSIKPFATATLVEAGLALSDAELALAAGSHFGEMMHVQAILRWLGRYDLHIESLRCGLLPPLSGSSSIPPRQGVTPAHNNSSGRHTALLTLACVKGWSQDDYLSPIHPVNALMHAKLRKLDLGPDYGSLSLERCGLPAYRVPLRTLALAAAKAACDRSGALCQVLDAITREPLMLGGSGSLSTAFVTSTNGRVIAKGGSDGIFIAFHRTDGCGLALKVESGSDRIASIALVHVARNLGWIKGTESALFVSALNALIFGASGQTTGHHKVLLI